jgi:hypothetical protein
MVAALRDGVGFVAASDIMELDGGMRFIARRPPRIDADRLLRRNVVGNQVLARRDDVIGCGAFDESLTASQDYDLWIRLVLRTGAGTGLPQPLQIVHARARRDRITTSLRRRHGVWRVYRKYVHLMSREQRKSHLFNLIRTTERGLSLRKLATLWSRDDAMRLIAHFLRTHRLLPNGLAESVVGAIDRARVGAALNAAGVPSERDAE